MNKRVSVWGFYHCIMTTHGDDQLEVPRLPWNYSGWPGKGEVLAGGALRPSLAAKPEAQARHCLHF